MTVAGFTSTGSKKPQSLFGNWGGHGGGDGDACDPPTRIHRSSGCRVSCADGREYLDFVMALGAVALGYSHPAVNAAVIEAIERGSVGSLAPDDEPALAAELAAMMPSLEQVRFFKTGAEAVAAAVRIARTATHRERVIGCGYHGWLDWCSDAAGVPEGTRSLYRTIPFNDPQQTLDIVAAVGDRLACVVIEPVIDAEPTSEWLGALRKGCDDVGAVLILDEIKTAFRVSAGGERGGKGGGGATERWMVRADLVVLGKALANGFPLAAVGGRVGLMASVNETWISSTLATEWVAMAAARATIQVIRSEQVPRHLHAVGRRLFDGLTGLVRVHDALGLRVAGIPEMCYLRSDTEALGSRIAVACARRGLLWKRNAYNFVSLAHDEAAIDRALTILADVLASC